VTDASPIERGHGVLRYHWGIWSAWAPQRWTLEFAVLCDGVVVGSQALSAHDFAVVRQVETGSWLGRAHQRQGIGTHMRQAVLHLAFEGLGAVLAVSAAFEDNPASLRVAAKLGYQPNGVDRIARRGRPATLHRLRLPRDTWAATTRPTVHMAGQDDSCLSWFGLPPAGGS